MRTIRQQIMLLAATCLLVVCVALAPATAEQGSDSDSSGSNDQSTNSGSSDNQGGMQAGSGDRTGDTTNQTETSGDSQTEQTGGLQGRANALLEQDRKVGHEHTTAQRLKNCQDQQNGINHKISNLSLHAQAFLDSFNKIFTQVQTFQSSHQLNVSDYDTLVAAVTAKQAAATSAVAALKGVSINIDCTATDPAASLASVKTAAGDARSALQAYRTSLRTLIQALLTAKNTSSATAGSAGDNSGTGATTGGN